MKNMRCLSVIYMLCLVSIFLMSCIKLEIVYTELVFSENSPLVFRFSNDDKFQKPAKIKDIRVLSADNFNGHRWFWHIHAIDKPVALREVVYGVVPAGFRELTKAVPLKPNLRYRVTIEGGTGGTIIEFAKRSGKYSIYGPREFLKSKTRE
jgi:hypothetical protein